MRILSWNVNGIRACIKKGLLDYLITENYDVICLQEIKADFDAFLGLSLETSLPEYQIYCNYSSLRKGYSGVCTLVKKYPLSVTKDLKVGNIDNEGRLVALEYENYYLVNIYFPHSSRDLSRLHYKKYFNSNILAFIKSLNKPAIMCGDFNVAHQEIDIARARQNIGNAGFTEVEKRWFSSLLALGYVDTFRYFYPNEVRYTWWLQNFNARSRNMGWRIDYVLAHQDLIDSIKAVDILDKVYGSDHCPVFVDIDLNSAV